MDEYINSLEGVRAFNTIKKYKLTLSRLRDYEKAKRVSLRFQDINMEFYDSFQKFTYERGLSTNYFGVMIQCVKVVFRTAKEVSRIHNLDNVDQRAFKTIEEPSDAIYLSTEELLKIHNLQFTEDTIRAAFNIERTSDIMRRIKSFEIVRAKFLIGAFTALRVSDFNRLDTINVKGEYISIRTQKTGSLVIIPMHWVIKEILEQGFDPSTAISEQKINSHIKQIAKMAGITENIQVTKNIGGKRVAMIFPKYELVTTHTCRRSGATNMVKYGIPIANVMKVTHKSLRSFMKYIRFDNEENAEMLKESGFFDKPLKGGE